MFHLFVLISTDAIGAKASGLYLFILPTDVNEDFFPLSLRLNVCKRKREKKKVIFSNSWNQELGIAIVCYW